MASEPAAPRRILVFGDSNSWGWIPRPDDLPSERLPTPQQWPFVMQTALGEGYEVVADALSGRTTDVADPTLPQLTGAGCDGSASLPAVLAAHLPLDVVVLMLGTNDNKALFARSAFRTALGAGQLIDIVQRSANLFSAGWYSYPAPTPLLVCPPPLGPQTVFAAEFEGGEARSRGLAHTYRHIAIAAGVPFFDAGRVIGTDGVDGVHLTQEAHRRFGDAMAGQVRAVLARRPSPAATGPA